jgi:hypothetical protein
MKISMLLLLGSQIALVATAILFLAFHDLWNAFIGVSCVVVALVLVGWMVYGPSEKCAGGRTVGVGTVCAAGKRQIRVQVTGVHGERFIGRLVQRDSDPVVSWLRPGALLLVAFDPAARERLSLPDDMLAVRASHASAT